MINKNQVRSALLNFGVRIRSGALTGPLIVLVLSLIACELGGIWSELKGIRREQVKNALYTLSPKQVERLRSGSNKEGVKNRLRVLTSEIGGITRTVDVDISQPVSVEIDNQPLSVEIER
jgi:hypothetical protein